jgi:aspartyl-tRNA(Asn)/glutamyl-tRNA(Gln) amidotransferase subunit B
MEYQPKIGLEIHVELKTNSKMFCSCKNDSLELRPNVNICPICMGHPGTLPVINEEAVKKVIKTGLALHCKIAEFSRFERKNYFYPDLPKGYQISQYVTPLCEGGYLEISIKEGKSEARSPKSERKFKKIRIRRVHLEEDTAKLIHPEGANYSLLDFNRAGIPLMELVTEPDITSAKEAKRFAQELQLILRYLGVSNADMEKGQMRVEANISLQLMRKTDAKQNAKPRENALGTKVEIKNLNSFKAVERAINYEIERQTKILSRGEKVIQETRGWDDKKEITVSQRTKEEAHDYRYFPEPDLPPLEFKKEYISEIQKEIPELPQQKRERFKEEFLLPEPIIETIISNKDLSEYFEKTISELLRWIKDKGLDKKETNKLIKTTANYLLSDALGLLKGKPFIEKDFPITPEDFAEFIIIIYQEKLTSKMAKILLEEMFKTGGDPSDIMKEKELIQVSDENEIEKIAQIVISSNPQAVEDFKRGKENALQFLIGQVMKETKGKANPEIAKRVLTKILNNV